MEKERLETFTDGVFAVVITVMVLELKVPSAPTWGSLLEQGSVFLSYVINFLYVGIYWNHHHHMLTLTRRINGMVMWSNLLFLCCLSLFPFSIAWLNKATPRPACVPTVFYGITLLLTMLSWQCLSRTLVSANGGSTSELQQARGSDRKAKLSVYAHVAAIVLAFRWPGVSCGLYAAMAGIWFVPDRPIEPTATQD
ncbi:TMEM175 family protein [Dyella soli]|uniref:DUF1211 domain-containing protein n=1 Tax=Dyella soli TaxID=522319 RepID=A0A4R0YT44_9GAMM|nr:TMEM175 family protein [Dyella soli]TCI09142.1 DUF1211 domain-containing protein [Dyella soli]